MKKTTLYVGLNDKDTKKQIIQTEDAENMASEIIATIGNGGTIYTTKGVYMHGNGEIVQETSLMIILFGTDADTENDIIDTLKKVFNQESIIKETTETVSAFM